MYNVKEYMKIKIPEKKDIKRFLPSVKTVFIISLLLLFAGGMLFIQKTGEKYVAGKNKKLLNPEVTVSDLADLDTDKDGVSDWEEKLWGTDPYLAVSNPDGVSDKDYVEKKKQEKQSRDLNDLSKNPETTSDKITNQMISTILAISEGGGEVKTEELAKALASSSVAQIQKEIAPRIYTRANFTIVGTSTAEINSYQKTLITVFSQQNTSDIAKGYALITESLKLDDSKTLEEAASYNKKIETMLRSMLLAKVPEIYAERHIMLTNDLSIMQKTTVSSLTLKADPLKGVALYSSYSNAIINLMNTLASFNTQQ
jgi:hypothetical protein